MQGKVDIWHLDTGGTIKKFRSLNFISRIHVTGKCSNCPSVYKFLNQKEAFN